MNPLSADKLYQSTDPDLFNFETTEELGALRASIGQERASEAIQFGIGNRRDGYNIFAMGTLGIGKHSLVMESFNQAAQERGPADDWCYVHNFDQSYKPRMLHFPPGEGISFKRDIEQLVQEMQPALSGAFESEEYQTRRQEIQEEVSSHQGEEIEAIRKEAEERNLRMMRTPGGLAFTPIKKGEILSPEEFQELPEDERQQIESDIEELQDRLKSVLLEQPRLQREIRERIKELNHEIAGLAIGGLFEELREKYAEHDKVIDYLHKMEEDIIENVEHFLVDSQQEKEDGLQTMLQNVRRRQADAFSQRYEVNVIVDNSEAERAPVIYEENPTYQNLIGRIEYQAEMGALRTNFTLIKGGALHRANGGYLPKFRAN